MEEIEVKFLNIVLPEVQKKLAELGAVCKGSHHSKRKLLDFPGLPLNERNAWVRLRDEGEKITLAYKERQGVKEFLHDEGMKEIEIIVSDFDVTNNFLAAIGMIEKRHEENMRERWVLNEVVFDIDSWPLLPTYIEIEGPTIEKVKEAANMLGFVWDEHIVCSPKDVYKHYGFDLGEYSVLTFDRQIKKESL